MADIYSETTKNVPQAKSEALNLIVGMVSRKSLEKMNKRMLPLSKRSKGFSKKLELCKNETREGGTSFQKVTIYFGNQVQLWTTKTK